jgi:lysophospholipase L1-like esterase
MERALKIKNRLLFFPLTLLIGGVAVFVIGELGVRVLDLPPRPLQALDIEHYRLTDNALILYEYIPGYSAEAKPYDRSHFGLRINATGFRDHDYSRKKRDGVFRIAFFGDSITAGNGVNDLRKTYTKELESILNSGVKTDHEAIEVLNFGVGGYHLLQTAETVRTRGVEFEPNYVAIGFCVNDLSTTADGGVVRRLKARISEEDASFVAHSQDQEGPGLRMAWLMSKSRLLFFSYYRVLSLSGTLPHKTQSKKMRSQLSERKLGLKALEILANYQREHQVPVVIFLIPAFDQPFSNYAHQKIHRKISKLAQAFPNIEVIDLTEAFEQSGRDPKTLAWDRIHPNEDGHRLLAEILAGYIRPTP